MKKEYKCERDFLFHQKENQIVWNRRAVCKRCHTVINDAEPCTKYGEFWHPRFDKKNKPYRCKNAGLCFNTSSVEIEPFMKKSERRNLKRLGINP